MNTFIKAVFIFMIAGNAYAKAYKCEVNGKTTYQQSPYPDAVATKTFYSDADRRENAWKKRRDEQSEKQRQAEISKSLHLAYPKPESFKKSPKELIDKQFSAWDGSHIKLAEVVKKIMADPSSFEHVRTTYNG